jgi:hypothetical protein
MKALRSSELGSRFGAYSQPSTVTSSSAAFGRWAFGIGQPPRDRRGRTGIVKGRSVRSAGNVLTTLSCSASGIFAICCDLTRPTITQLARTFQSTRTRRRREQYMPLVALCLRHFLADSTICTCEFDFRQGQGNARVRGGMIQLAWRFLLFQKDSALAQWYRTRTEGGRNRKTTIVALARKLLIALWRLVTTGEVPAGVVLRAA